MSGIIIVVVDRAHCYSGDCCDSIRIRGSGIVRRLTC
jgi:hypothetical protein